MSEYSTYRLDCGHVHVVCVQSKTDECAEACAGMVIAMTKARFVDLATLRATSQAVGGAEYRPSPKDAGAKVKDPRYAALASVLMAGKGSEAGTGGGNLVDILRSFGVASTRHRGSVATTIKDAAATGKPVIAGVSWSGGGGHFIVIHGSSKQKYCVLDPGHEGVVNTTPVGSVSYMSPYGSTGVFDECIVLN